MDTLYKPVCSMPRIPVSCLIKKSGFSLLSLSCPSGRFPYCSLNILRKCCSFFLLFRFLFVHKNTQLLGCMGGILLRSKGMVRFYVMLIYSLALPESDELLCLPQSNLFLHLCSLLVQLGIPTYPDDSLQCRRRFLPVYCTQPVPIILSC